MSRILRHISAKDLRRIHQKKLSEQKKLAAQKLKERQEAEEERRQIEEIARPYKSNWRSELNEMMTTADMGMAYYQAQGDADIVDNATALIGFEGQNAAVSGGTVTLTDDGDNDIANGTHTAFRQAFYTVDGSKSSHLKITISKGGGTSSWTDRGESWDDDVTLVVSDADDFFAPTYDTYNLTSGTHIIKLPGNYKNTMVYLAQFAKLASDGSPGTTGSLKIYNVSFQRRTPLNVFVSLDDPDANTFIRGGLGGSEERRKRLKDQLEASNDLMDKLGLEPSKTSPGDIKLAQALPYTDMDDAFDDPYYKGPPPDIDDDSDFPDLDIPLAKGKGNKIAAAGNPRGTGGKSAGDPENIQWPRNKYPNKKAPPGPGYRPPTA